MKFFYTLAILLFISCNSEENLTSESTEESVEIDHKALHDSAQVATEETTTELTEEKSNNDWDKMNLKGDVKSVSIHEFDVDDEGEEIGMGGSTEAYSFNVDGYIKELYAYGCCGMEPEYYEYIYNNVGQLTHRKKFLDPDYDETFAEFVEKEKYFYNSDSVLVKIKYAGENKELSKETSFKYNDDGTIKLEKTDYVQDGEYLECSFFYGPDYKTENATGSEDWMNYSVTEYYNEDGLLIRDEKEFSAGKQVTKYEYKFDDRGNWIKRTSLYKYENEDEWRPSTTVTRSIKYFN